MDEGQKLKIFQHNKNWQKKLGKNLTHYKRYSGKYIIYEESGKIKIYDNYINKLIYEGEYAKGKKDGNGKEYSYYGKIIFEGEYSNGKRNGKGKEYDVRGNLIFEGEYLNGKRWNGKGYNGTNCLVYELKEGKGYVKEFSDFRLIYESEYLNGEKNGKNIQKYSIS